MMFTDPDGRVYGTAIGAETGNPVGVAVAPQLILASHCGASWAGAVGIMPDLGPLAGSVSGPPLMNSPWGGPLDDGVLFGSGTTDPFIFSATAAGGGNVR